MLVRCHGRVEVFPHINSFRANNNSVKFKNEYYSHFTDEATETESRN